MKEKILKLSRFLLLCAVMFLVTMIPQSVKAITVEEAGEVYMTDSQAGAGQPLYGRLNINYTGNGLTIFLQTITPMTVKKTSIKPQKRY